jgi:glycosyltransferase involved in cell wall biosynthesis
MPRVLFISKPIAPPFHDGTKCLVRDVATALRAFQPVVLTTSEGKAHLPPGVVGRAVYGGTGAFAPALLENARAALAVALGPKDDVWHFVFAPNRRTCQVARGLRALRRLPIVQTVASPPRRFEHVASLVFGDELVAQSQATAEALREAARVEGFRLPEVSVVPPPVGPLTVPSVEQAQAARRELGIGTRERLVLYPGDLEVSSGASVTAALVKPLLERLPGAVVVFAYRNKTPAAASKAAELRRSLAGLPVRITDRVSSMPALLAASDMVIFPVDDLWGKVDQPIVLLESMALGVPCAVLDRGPLRDVEGAVKLSDLDAHAWLAAIVAHAAPGEARERARAAGREAVRTVYASGVVARAYEAIYLRAIQRRADLST